MKKWLVVFLCFLSESSFGVGAILYMRLNESEGLTTFMDSSGNNYDGTCTNCPTRGAFGMFNPAMTFDGVNDAITGMPVGAMGTADRTLSAWVRITTTASGMILTNRSVVGENSLSLHASVFAGAGTANGNAYFSWDGGGCNVGARGSSNITDGDFHHLVGVRSGADYFIYVDGTMENTNNASGGSGTCWASSADSTSNWLIGSGPAWGVFWNGTISEVSIYDSALTRSQIRGMYMRGVNRYIEASRDWARLLPYTPTYFEQNLGL